MKDVYPENARGSNDLSYFGRISPIDKGIRAPLHEKYTTFPFHTSIGPNVGSTTFCW